MNIHNLITLKNSLFILLQIIYKISSITSFDYPYSITLSNDNIFLIQKTGINIYDISLNKFNQTYEFKEEDEISEENFSKISIKYNKEYILSIINDKIFIFNNEGKLLYKSEEKINGNLIIYSYSLTFINEANKTCDFIIGYFGVQSYLNLSKYRYDEEKNNITFLNNFKTNAYNYKIYEVYTSYKKLFQFYKNQTLLSCEYMYSRYYSNYRNFLVCFFNYEVNVGIVIFDIFNNNEIMVFTELNKDYIYISSENIDNSKIITSIKSELNNDRNLAIVWWDLKDNYQTRYFIFDLEYVILRSNINFKSGRDSLYSWKMPNTCITKEYESRNNLFPYKDQFAFSCIIGEENIQILLYNKTNLMNDSFIINVSCENNNELSKLYFNDNKNYLLYPCLKNCSDKQFQNDIDCLNKREKGENKKKNTIMIIIIIAIMIIILLIIFIIILRKYFSNNNKSERIWKKEKEDEKIMKDILSDLMQQ